MTALQLRLSGVQAASLTGLLALAAAVGAGAAYRPAVAAGVVLAASVVVGIAAVPSAGAGLVILVTLLFGGIERDALMPVFRPHEATLLLVIAGVGLHLALSARTERVLPRPSAMEAVLLMLATAGSVLPLMWMAIRGSDIVTDDVVYALHLWKYLAVYAIVRITIRSEPEVRRTLWLILAVAVPVAIVGIMQSLHLFGVHEFIVERYSPSDELSDYSPNRATGTLGSSFAMADVMVFSLGIAAAFMVYGSRRRILLGALCVLFVFGTFASGQFTALIGVVVAVVVFGLVTRTVGRVALAVSASAAAAAIALQPVIEARLSRIDTASGLPPSWRGRLENLETFFWPRLGEELNWLLGVRPGARIRATETWRDWIYIESGHTWLVWTGGVLFAVLFFVFLGLALSWVLRVARSRRDAIGVAAVASATSLGVIAVLMTLDPHLIFRGAAEVTFTLLALALVAGVPASSRAAPRHGR